MGDVKAILGTAIRDKDIGITKGAGTKVSLHCGIAASKGDLIDGLVIRNIAYKENDSFYLCTNQYLGLINITVYTIGCLVVRKIWIRERTNTEDSKHFFFRTGRSNL